jgi:hypothetical protein
VAVREAIAGPDALVAQRGLLELECLVAADLQVRRAVEPDADWSIATSIAMYRAVTGST